MMPNGLQMSSLTIYKVLAMLIILSLLSINWFYSRANQDDKIQLALESLAAEFALGASEIIHHSARDLQAASKVISIFKGTKYSEFARFSKRYLAEESGLLIVEWQPLVLESERERFIQKTRENGQTDFDLWEPDSTGEAIPAKQRTEHFPVLYMLTDVEATDTTGLDLAWSTERMASKIEARNTGNPQASNFFTVVTGKKQEHHPLGFSITYPIYVDDTVPNRIEERKANLLGYMAGIYSIDTVLSPLMNKLVNENVNIIIKDNTNSGLALSKKSGEDTRHARTVAMPIFGEDWSIEITANEKFISNSQDIAWYLNSLLLLMFGGVILLFFQLVEKKNKLLSTNKEQLSIALEKVTLSEQNLLSLSRLDPLTGLYNRRAFEELLNLELDRCKRLKNPETTLVIIDIDYFKQVNDEWGHPVGDLVLTNLAKILKNVTRSIDMIARIGGEEFVMILTKTDEKAALEITERLRKDIESLVIHTGTHQKTITITVSMGISQVTRHISKKKLIEQADEALYEAKKNGRNRVEVYHPKDQDSPSN